MSDRRLTLPTGCEAGEGGQCRRTWWDKNGVRTSQCPRCLNAWARAVRKVGPGFPSLGVDALRAIAENA